MLDKTALLRDFLHCPYKAFLKLTGATGDISAYEQLQVILEAEHRQRATAFLMEKHPDSETTRRPKSLKSAIRGQARLFLEVADSDGKNCWNFDAIESSGPGENGEKLVQPIRFVNSAKLSLNDKILAAADGIRLTEILGRSVEQVAVVHGIGPSITKVKLATKSGQTKAAKEAQEAFAALEAMIGDTTKEPKLVLNPHCDVCEFRLRCRAEAERRDDLSLLRGLHRTEIETLNGRGVFTVTQLAYTCRTKAIERSKVASKKHNMPLQAMAIRDKTIYVRKKPELLNAPVKIYLDIEGVPERGFYYLIGMLIDRQEGSVSHQFWADTDEDEQKIWDLLRKELATAGDFTLFHFGRYESEFLEQMRIKYGPNDAEDGIIPQSRLCDVHAMIRTNVFFPAYSNNLKSIASILGEKWSGSITSGLDTLVWRHRWERERQVSMREELLRYNMEDCIALRTVAAFLDNLDAPGGITGLEVKTTDRIPKPSAFSFGQNRYSIPELARFTKCAYFNYQRDKVHVRTEKRVRRSSNRKQRNRKNKSTVNERIECPAPTACPKCGSDRIKTHQRRGSKKVVQELKFTARGVKRWVVEYSTDRHQCSACRNTCYSNEYPTNGSRLGYTVAAWSAYQQVALRQTGYAIAESFQDLFGLWVSSNTATRLRRTLADFHEKTEAVLLERLRKGIVLCADEAKIEIKKKSGYVWVFSNTEEVLYRFSPSRESTVVEQVLDGFGGVLVSDFYGAYDLPAFKQQKCLIHLIRDVNDDLLKAPFNSELKEMAERFTEVLRPIIDAVDKYGLKKRHLGKFVQKSARFLEWVRTRRYESDVAQGYQKRFQKHGPRMFTFLEHDGVPWNNNLAENAVKAIASRRSTLGASFSEEGIQDFLRLLSIYQTLRRKGGSFLRFLLSKQTDIFAFLRE